MADFKPFEDKEEVEKIKAKREELIGSLSEFDLEDTERMFLVRKINNITEKLLKKARK